MLKMVSLTFKITKHDNFYTGKAMYNDYIFIVHGNNEEEIIKQVEDELEKYEKVHSTRFSYVFFDWK
jgi:hypothetical protein